MLAGRGRETAIKRRARRKIWSREQRRIRAGGKPKPSLRRVGKLVWMRVKAPSYLCVGNLTYRTATVQFLGDLRAQTRREGVGLIIDLSGVTTIRPTGAVMLLAEIERAVAGQDSASLQIIRSNDAVIDAVMCHLGIYITDEGPTPEAEREDVRHWRVASGVASEGEKGGSLFGDYEGRLADGLTGDLYNGIVEAMTNTVHHAYAGVAGEELRKYVGKRWWALSQERDGELTIAICDLGIGIPRSLPRSATFSSELVRAAWKRLGLDKSDANAIKVAIELGRTSTGQDGRGRGLSEIVEAANLSEEGSVLISSNRGTFVLFEGKRYARDHSHSIRGTLIHWTVRISETDAENGEKSD